jgi:hypothetical protein
MILPVRNPLPRKQMVERLSVADPLFVPLTTGGADPRSESYRYGCNTGTPQVKILVDKGAISTVSVMPLPGVNQYHLEDSDRGEVATPYRAFIALTSREP